MHQVSCPGSGGVITPGGVQEPRRCGQWAQWERGPQRPFSSLMVLWFFIGSGDLLHFRPLPETNSIVAPGMEKSNVQRGCTEPVKGSRARTNKLQGHKAASNKNTFIFTLFNVSQSQTTLDDKRYCYIASMWVISLTLYKNTNYYCKIKKIRKSDSAQDSEKITEFPRGFCTMGFL